jgi:hypothetical protein
VLAADLPTPFLTADLDVDERNVDLSACDARPGLGEK